MNEIERVIRQRVGASAFANWFGMEFAHFGDGECEIRLALQPHHLNPGGIIHGGVVATMLDAAIGLALRTKLGLGSAHVTLNLNIQYIGMATGGTVIARGRAVHPGKRAAHGEGSLESEDGRLLARGTGTFITVEPRRLPNTPFGDS